MEETNGVVIKHASKGRDYRPPELPHFSVDCYCAETNKIYEFFWGAIGTGPIVRRFVTPHHEWRSARRQIRTDNVTISAAN